MKNLGFTLVEILVASTLFLSLMGITAIAFQRVASGGDKAMQIIALHTKADVILRTMESDFRNIPAVSAMQLDTDSDPISFTFMRPVHDTNYNYFHKGKTEPDTNYFQDTSPRLTDIIWVRWEWDSGALHRGQSRINQSNVATTIGSNDTYGVGTRAKLKTLNVLADVPTGMQNNAITPTMQQHFEYFEGTGASIHAVNANGSSSADVSEKLAVCEIVASSNFTGNDCDLFDTDLAPWRNGQARADYEHLYTTAELGNDNTVAGAYAVRNADGKTVNKDKLNLLGCDADDGSGNKIYPSQMVYLFHGIEYFELQVIGRNGAVIDSSSETDRMNDGANSLDVSGVDPITGIGYDARPAVVRISYLLHSVALSEIDELDFDGDGDVLETLAQAIADVVAGESWSNRIERVKSFKKHAQSFGYASVLFTQTVELGY